MKIFKDFKCSKSGVVFTRRVVNNVTVAVCKCGGEAARVISAPKMLGNTTGGNASFNKKRV